MADTRTKLQLTDWVYTMDPAALPAGYVLIARSPPDASGYQGAAVGRPDPAASLRDHAPRYAEILVVNRGTEFTTMAQNAAEARRDTLADLQVRAGLRDVPQLQRAAAFYLQIQHEYGTASNVRVDATGHSLGGTCAYYQRAAAIAAHLPAADLPQVEVFAALGGEATIARRYPEVRASAFELSVNHVRRDDRFTGPYSVGANMPRWGTTILLPGDPDARGFLGAHDTVSLLRYYGGRELAPMLER